MEPEKQTLEQPNPNKTGEEWETAAREWVSSLPELTVTDVENWVSSNRTTLPDRIINMPSQELYQYFINSVIIITQTQTQIVPIIKQPPPPPIQDSHYDAEHPYRFQRSDVWKPVYTWLESFDNDNLIKSQDILDWLTENPEIREQLYVKHSRYHVMHYIKKCHIKMLKRREKKKGVQPTSVPKPIRVPKIEATKQPLQVPYNTSNNLPKDRDLYTTKRTEALQKYDILLELEKQLSAVFPKAQTVDQMEGDSFSTML